jgi:hypothetical protein
MLFPRTSRANSVWRSGGAIRITGATASRRHRTASDGSQCKGSQSRTIALGVKRDDNNRTPRKAEALDFARQALSQTIVPNAEQRTAISEYYGPALLQIRWAKARRRPIGAISRLKKQQREASSGKVFPMGTSDKTATIRMFRHAIEMQVGE